MTVFQNFTRLVLVGTAFCGLTEGATAQYSSSSEPDMISISGGVGFARLLSNEYVYSGGNPLSQLVWDAPTIPVITGAIEAPIDGPWRMRASGEAGLGGDASMTDYDWIAPFATGYGPDDWSHRSLHPDTRVDHYINAGLRLGRDIAEADGMHFGLHLEAGYTDVQWTAYGGSYIYSVASLRDTIGTIPDGTAGVTYRQMLPMGLVGADARYQAGGFEFKAAAQAGVTIGATAIDDHWLRDLRFTDRFFLLPVVAADVEASYAFSQGLNIFAGGSVKSVFSQNGDTTEVDTTTGATATFAGAAGTDLLAISARVGLKGEF